MPTFTSRTDYCSQFGFAYEDDRKTMQMVRQQTDKLDAIWEEFSRTFDGHRPEAVVREAFGDYYQRLDWLEAVVINLLPGITFATYGTVRATFVAARCQGAEALRCLTRPGATSSPVLPPQRRAITG